MTGIEDPDIWCAYLLCILATVFCVCYSIWNWNSGNNNHPTREDVEWVQTEKEIEKSLPAD